MDLGIEGFKNYELLKGITIVAILKNGQINAFYETIKYKVVKGRIDFAT